MVFTLGVFLFFALITHWTPMAGDDWVYAVGGMWNNPFVQAFRMYQTWSGRYLSELWGFLVAPHKNLWNILNPLLFTGILLFLVCLSGSKKHMLVRAVILFALMLGVGNRVRMQTYTWIMGTTYVIPLFLFLLQILLVRQFLSFDDFPLGKYAALCGLNLCIPLYMENAAALMCGADMLVLLYCLFIKKERQKAVRFLLPFAFAAAGTLIILLSPGAAARLANDNAVFNSLSFGEKIAQNWPLFLEHTFTESAMVTRVFVIAAGLWALMHAKEKPVLYGLLIAAAAALLLHNGLLYLLFVIGLVIALAVYEQNERIRWFLVYLLLCALGADLVMLVSPIFDSRSALYSVYMLILASAVLLETVLPEDRRVMYLTAAVFGVIGIVEMLGYYDIYHMVHLINIRRNQQIEYYRLRPDAGDAWLLAYPDESIHSANVQEGDDTHMYYFKEYYYLSQDLHLVFYYLDEYNAETIFAPTE